jgi:hypothetical protein
MKAKKTTAPNVKEAIPVRTDRERFEDFLKGFTFK